MTRLLGEALEISGHRTANHPETWPRADRVARPQQHEHQQQQRERQRRFGWEREHRQQRELQQQRFR